MKRMILTIVCALFSCSIIAQTTYNMKIKQGTGSTLSATSSVDEITFPLASSFTCGDVILYGGETYHTVSIGSQCWFQENLNIGTRIDAATGQANNTPTNIIEKYCYGNSDASCITYGGLYQWAEAVQYLNGATNTTSPDPALTGNVQGICPTGWHIPTQAEFQSLSTVVVGNSNPLKALGQGTLDGIGTNTSGFSALLAGYCDYWGVFDNLERDIYFWSSTEFNGYEAGDLHLITTGSIIYLYGEVKFSGLSVRCVKD